MNYWIILKELEEAFFFIKKIFLGLSFFLIVNEGNEKFSKKLSISA